MKRMTIFCAHASESGPGGLLLAGFYRRCGSASDPLECILRAGGHPETLQVSKRLGSRHSKRSDSDFAGI